MLPPARPNARTAGLTTRTVPRVRAPVWHALLAASRREELPLLARPAVLVRPATTATATVAPRPRVSVLLGLASVRRASLRARVKSCVQAVETTISTALDLRPQHAQCVARARLRPGIQARRARHARRAQRVTNAMVRTTKSHARRGNSAMPTRTRARNVAATTRTQARRRKPAPHARQVPTPAGAPALLTHVAMRVCPGLSAMVRAHRRHASLAHTRTAVARTSAKTAAKTISTQVQAKSAARRAIRKASRMVGPPRRAKRARLARPVSTAMERTQ